MFVSTPAKRTRTNGLGAILLLATVGMMLSWQTVAAQTFADIKYSRVPDNKPKSAKQKLNPSSSVWDYMAAQTTDFLSLESFKEYKNQAQKLYGMLTNDETLINENNQLHRKKGAMCSGNGEHAEAIKRQRKLEERDRIVSMLENKQVATDIPTSNKMYEMWLETTKDKKGVQQNDKHDFVPHETVYLHAEDMMEMEDFDITPGREGRRLKSTINSDEATINRLEEPYPTDCHNHGKLAKITQKYYMCKSLKQGNQQKPSEPFRVDIDTYQMLHSNYSDQYSCYTQNVENNVCVCPPGTVDYVCATELYTRCYINITNPAFYAGCQDQFEDSFYYMYSIPGFSPCFFYNFNSSIDVEFELNCQQIEVNGTVNANKEPDLGYPYRDVIKDPSTSSFTYVSQSPETEFMVNSVPVSVYFNFRDMKYLSKSKQFISEMNAEKQGISTGTVNIDFSELQSSDASGNSRYIVGGRTYFEASAFGGDVNSFTFRGFFDEEGYEEPRSKLHKLKSSGWLYAIIGIGLGLIVLGIVLYCCCKKSKEQIREEKYKKQE